MIKSDLGNVVDAGKELGMSLITLIDDIFYEVKWSKPVLYGSAFVLTPVWFVQGIKKNVKKKREKGLPGEWENTTMNLVGRDDIIEAL